MTTQEMNKFIDQLNEAELDYLIKACQLQLKCKAALKEIQNG